MGNRVARNHAMLDGRPFPRDTLYSLMGLVMVAGDEDDLGVLRRLIREFDVREGFIALRQEDDFVVAVAESA